MEERPKFWKEKKTEAVMEMDTIKARRGRKEKNMKKGRGQTRKIDET